MLTLVLRSVTHVTLVSILETKVIPIDIKHRFSGMKRKRNADSRPTIYVRRLSIYLSVFPCHSFLLLLRYKFIYIFDSNFFQFPIFQQAVILRTVFIRHRRYFFLTSLTYVYLNTTTNYQYRIPKTPPILKCIYAYSFLEQYSRENEQKQKPRKILSLLSSFTSLLNNFVPILVDESRQEPVKQQNSSGFASLTGTRVLNRRLRRATGIKASHSVYPKQLREPKAFLCGKPGTSKAASWPSSSLSNETSLSFRIAAL